MKIGVLNNLYEPFNRGGAEKVVAAMINDWRASGHEVFLITTKPRSTATPETKALKIYYLDSRYYNLAETSLGYRFFWHLNNIFSLGKTRTIKKILRAEKPNLVVTHNLMGLGFRLPLVLKKLHIRHEHFLHDIQLLHPSGLMFYGQEKKINSLAARLYQALTRSFFASPAKIISPSRWLLKQHQQRGFFKNSDQEIKRLDFLAASVPAEPEKPITSNRRRYLFVGQMETHKGIFLLIKAFKKLNDPTARLSMVGDGTKLAVAQATAKADKRIEFFGRQEGDNFKRIISNSDCLVVPSLCYENSPTIIYEAHAQGLPVIAARLGGIPEIIGPKDVLFNTGDEDDLKNKLEKLGK